MTEESTEATERDDEQAESSGADSEEGKAEQREERDPPAGESDGDEGGDDAEASTDDEDEESKKAQEKEEEREQAADKIRELEKEGPPKDLEDWPDDAAKYETFGGAEGEHGYHEGPEEEKLGPSSLRHHEDGKVTVAGEEVDDPDEYKGEPIPGGPTDPDSPKVSGERDLTEDQEDGEQKDEES